jgi:outer membrane immunogenic protein
MEVIMHNMHKLCAAAAVASALLAISGAQAADIPRPMPAPAPVFVPPPAFSWSGFYLGGNVGAALAHHRTQDTLFGLEWGRTSESVFAGGGQVGYNWQNGNFVLGVEAEFEGIASNDDKAGVVVPGIGTLQARSHDSWLTTVAARFGWAYDHWLWYGKAGGGWVGNNGFTVFNLNTGASVTGGADRSSGGYLLGVGSEYAFANSWTMKLEYEYFGLGSQTFAVPAGSPFLAGDGFKTDRRSVQTLKLGFNYLFNWGGMR